MSNEGRSNGANLVTPGRYALRVLLCVPVWIEYVILLEKLKYDTRNCDIHKVKCEIWWIADAIDLSRSNQPPNELVLFARLLPWLLVLFCKVLLASFADNNTVLELVGHSH